jgi:hypothetical protein
MKNLTLFTVVMTFGKYVLICPLWIQMGRAILLKQ